MPVRRHPLKMVCLPISPLPHSVNPPSITKPPMPGNCARRALGKESTTHSNERFSVSYRTGKCFASVATQTEGCVDFIPQFRYSGNLARCCRVGVLWHPTWPLKTSGRRRRDRPPAAGCLCSSGELSQGSLFMQFLRSSPEQACLAVGRYLALAGFARVNVDCATKGGDGFAGTAVSGCIPADFCGLEGRRDVDLCSKRQGDCPQVVCDGR